MLSLHYGAVFKKPLSKPLCLGFLILALSLGLLIAPSRPASAATCTFATASAGATFSGSATSGNAVDNFANDTHTFVVTCDNRTGYSVKAYASALSTPYASIPFVNFADYTESGNSKWTSKINSGDPDAVFGTSAANPLVIKSSTAPVENDVFSLTYKAYVGTNTSSGAYSGTAEYTLVANEVPDLAYSIKYDANDGTGAPDPTTGTVPDEGSTVTLPTTTPTREYHDFLGWSKTKLTASTATPTDVDIYAAGDPLDIAYEDAPTIQLYAVWQLQSYSYTIKYDANGGTGAPADQTGSIALLPSTAVKLSSTAPTREHYDFLGWSTDAAATTADYQADGDITISSNEQTIQLYAIWEQKTYAYALNFDANGGTNAPAALTGTADATDDTTLTIPDTAPTRSGYAFLGWADAATATAAGYSAGDTITLDKDNPTKTIYAVWQQLASMQSFRCSTLNEGDQTTLYDTRDDKQYLAGKLKDGRCWMLQNLAIAYDTETSIETWDYDSKATGSYNLPASSTSGFSSETTAYVYKGSHNDAMADSTSNTGAYYSFLAATAGTGTGSSGETTTSICPKGWRLPSKDMFVDLAKAYGGTGENDDANIKYGSNFSNAYQAALLGNYDNSALDGSGLIGYWWSSTILSNKSGYKLLLYTSHGGPRSTSYKRFGYPVRCTADTYQWAVNYNANAGSDTVTNMPDNATSQESVGSSYEYTIPSSKPKRTGYVFLGWATDPSATTAEYAAGSKITFSSTTTTDLYALWAEIVPLSGNFQDLTTTACAAATTWDSDQSDDTTYSLKDTRDDKEYLVRKLADGNCWMTQNLAIEGNTDGTTKTVETWDYSTKTTGSYDLPASTVRGFNTHLEAFMNNGNHINNTANAPTTNTGAFYSFLAATAGTGTSDSYAETTTSICPKGWRLPSTNMFVDLSKAYGGNGWNNDPNIKYGSDFANAYQAALVGYYLTGGYNTQPYGRWWSSTINSDYSYSLHLNSVSGYAKGTHHKAYGLSVRCVFSGQ